MKTPVVLAIDLGGSEIKLGLIKGSVVERQWNLKADNQSGLATSLERISESVGRTLEGTSFEVASVGFGFPGLVDSKKNRIIGSNGKYPDAADIDLALWASRSWKAELVLENDAKLAALGEWRFGAAVGTQNSVTVTFGTGIGTGVVLDGRLLGGATQRAGNLGGHFPLSWSTEVLCSCGNRGCAEALASSWALRRDLQASPPKGALRSHDPTRVGYKQVFDAVREGDEEATAILGQTLRVWSSLLVALVHAYDPEVVVLAGNIMKAEDLLLPSVRTYVATHAWTPGRSVDVRVGLCGESAALLGAGFLADARG